MIFFNNLPAIRDSSKWLHVPPTAYRKIGMGLPTSNPVKNVTTKFEKLTSTNQTIRCSQLEKDVNGEHRGWDIVYITSKF